MKEAKLVGNLKEAAFVLNARQARVEHPDGSFDIGGSWRPSESEKCICCLGLRPPTRRWRFGLLLHCRTAEHVAWLYEVDRAELIRLAKKLNAEPIK